MMCKKTSSRWSAAKLLLILPLVALSLAATATTVYVPKELNKGNENFVETQIVADDGDENSKSNNLYPMTKSELRGYLLQNLQNKQNLVGMIYADVKVLPDGKVVEAKVAPAPGEKDGMQPLVNEVKRVLGNAEITERKPAKEVTYRFEISFGRHENGELFWSEVKASDVAITVLNWVEFGEVSGRVIDAKTKKPIPDVILLVNGAGVGTHSDASGCYSLKKLPEGKYTFITSCVGYKSVKKDFEISSKKSVEVNFELEEQAVAVDEIVVDKNKTAAQNESNVKNTKFEKGDIVEMKSTTGESMRVKYVGDFASALVLIDGKEGKIENIGVDDIESFTVLKDEQATKIYGEKGKNGVVLITTKKAAQANKQQPAQEAFIKVESMPTFQGGDLNGYRNWVQSQLQYPAEAKEKGISGRVIFSFVVEKDGSVSNFDALQAPDKILVGEVERVFKLTPKWEPGKQNGKAVRVKYTVPVVFALENKTAAQSEPAVAKTQTASVKPMQEEAFIKVESMPTFQGGDLNGYRNWVQSQLQYPAEAKEKGISGRVIFSFVVEKDGSVTSFKGLQAPDKILVDEVERVFKLTPKWEPGKQNGNAVRVKYTVPIVFTLQ